MSGIVQPDRGAGFPDQPAPAAEAVAARSRHRVALELEIQGTLDDADPEDWDLQDLARALNAGVARPLRTIRGLVLDPEHDRLSSTLEAMAADIEEAVELQWLATSRPWPLLARALQAPRPSLESLVELEQIAKLARRAAHRLAHQGL
jgi:hypothetical protein